MLMITVLEIQQGKEQIAGHGNIPADEQAGRPGPRAQALKNTVQGYVEISYETTPSETRISVSDTGRGIPEEKLGIIFERFEKADAFIQGAGLGLPICRSIMEHMNGTIEVTSTVNKGSTFTVVFPCQVRPME